MGERKGGLEDEPLFGWTVPDEESREVEGDAEEAQLNAAYEAAYADFMKNIAPQMNARQHALESVRYTPEQRKIREERGSLELIFSHDPKDRELQERYLAALERLSNAYDALQKYKDRKQKKT